ncbi:MAG: family 10 glycosylhydrolase [Armatimonadota bacterium]|nr:MAG: family 10 glycosylhydrolase [Armatimonadota bacterium]
MTLTVMLALGLLLFVMAGTGGAAPQPRNAPKVIVVNNDGFSDFYGGHYDSAQAIRESILPYRDTQVAVLEWCITSGSRVNYPSEVTEIIGEGMTEFPRRGDKLACETMQQLAAEGVDTLAVVCKAAHDAGVQCYASMRMNGDYPGSWMGEGIPAMFNSNFWREHPEFRVRDKNGEDRTKLSYAFAEVRDFKLRILAEAAQRDIDGINLDYLRHPAFFGYDEPLVKAFQDAYGQDPRQLPDDEARWLEMRAGVMTDFVRSVRSMLDAAGQAKGRHLGLSARVDWREYRQWGCDIERWMKDGLLDYLVVAQHSLGGYEFDLAPFAAMADGTGCAIYFGEEPTLSGHDRTPEEDKAIAEGKMKPPERDHLSLEQYCDRARTWYAAGADGIHIFNDWRNLPVLGVLGDPAKFPPAARQP